MLQRPQYEMPAWVRDAIASAHCVDAYAARPPYQRNDYLGWIIRAKQETTKKKRLTQMIDELRRGDVYMNMSWYGGKKERSGGVPHGLVDEYLVGWSGEILDRALTVRELILRVAPDAKESLAYGMPAYVFRGKPLVYFGVYKKHLGFYATPEVHDHFAGALRGYKQGKGSVQFPHSQPLPLALIEKMISYKKSILEQR